MSEVKRYRFISSNGYAAIPVVDSVKAERYVEEQDFDRVTAELDAAKETLERWHELNLQREARMDALQQRLTAADERVDVLEVLLRNIWHVVPNGYKSEIDAALKPAEGSNTTTCTWSHDGIGIWSGSCGTKWAFSDDGPTENGMHFCHSCGKALVVADEGEGDDWNDRIEKLGSAFLE